MYIIMKKICKVCNKEITQQNMPRHRKSRLHKLNEIIQVSNEKK